MKKILIFIASGFIVISSLQAKTINAISANESVVIYSEGDQKALKKRKKELNKKAQYLKEEERIVSQKIKLEKKQARLDKKDKKLQHKNNGR